MSDMTSIVVHTFESGGVAAERGETMGMTVTVREFDGGRSMGMTKVPGFVIVETGSQALAFDEEQLLHQIKKLYKISVILEHEGTEGDFALP